MYNGIGLQTPRGSGTNGYVQRNWASVRKTKDSVNYRTEEEIAKLDSASNKQPNQEILDHERKRKIEVKCTELEDKLEEQGLPKEEIAARVAAFRAKLSETSCEKDVPKDEYGRVAVRETHAVAEAQQEKNARLRDAFGISPRFVEGTSLDPERRAREEAQRYPLVRTPSHEREQRDQTAKKKKKRSTSPEAKKSKKKKSKKNKKEKNESSKKKKKRSKSSESELSSSSEGSDSETSADDRQKKKKKKKSNSKRRASSGHSSRGSSSERQEREKHSERSSEVQGNERGKYREREDRNQRFDEPKRSGHGSYRGRDKSRSYERKSSSEVRSPERKHKSHITKIENKKRIDKDEFDLERPIESNSKRDRRRSPSSDYETISKKRDKRDRQRDSSESPPPEKKRRRSRSYNNKKEDSSYTKKSKRDDSYYQKESMKDYYQQKETRKDDSNPKESRRDNDKYRRDKSFENKRSVRKSVSPEYQRKDGNRRDERPDERKRSDNEKRNNKNDRHESSRCEREVDDIKRKLRKSSSIEERGKYRVMSPKIKKSYKNSDNKEPERYYKKARQQRSHSRDSSLESPPRQRPSTVTKVSKETYHREREDTPSIDCKKRSPSREYSRKSSTPRNIDRKSDKCKTFIKINDPKRRRSRSLRKSSSPHESNRFSKEKQRKSRSKSKSLSPSKRSSKKERNSITPKRKSERRTSSPIKERREDKRTSSCKDKYEKKKDTKEPVKEISKSGSEPKSRSSSSLSYSPARRSPERYREIIENLPEKDKRKYIKSPSDLHPKKKKNKEDYKPKTVCMRSSSSENDDSEDDFLRMDLHARQELLNMKELDRLKERLAKLTKATMERNRIEETGPSTSQGLSEQKLGWEIASKSPKEAEKEIPNQISPKKIDSLRKESPMRVESSKVKDRKRSRSRSWSRTSSRSRSKSRSRSGSRVKSSRSRSKSRVKSSRSSGSRSRSRSSRSRSYSSRSRSSRSSSYSSRSSSRSSRSSSRSTRSSRTMTGVYADYRRSSSTRSKSRSPSIPRRAGSPSFLDRRRITSAPIIDVTYSNKKYKYRSR